MKFQSRTSRTLVPALLIATLITGCTKPKQTTAVGTAAGGAIGAGLGAIVGNQTGNPGSGLAIGAVAGAATGALIGNALQAQQEKSDSQKESIQRHEQTIRAQRSELQELRRMQSDTGYTAPRAQTVNAYLVEQKRLQLQRRGPSPKGESLSTYSPPPLSGRASEPLARYDAKPAPRAPVPVALPAEPETPIKKAPTQNTAGKGLQERDLASEAATQARIKEELSAPPSGDPPSSVSSAKPSSVKAERNADPSQEPTTPASTSSNSTAQAAAKQASGDSCVEAQEAKEAQQAAASASENSDKLFHLRKALRLCPNSAETHYELGKVYLSMDRAADANYEFKQSLSIDPNYASAQESLKDLDQGKTHY